MKILIGDQIAQADQFTMQNEPIESINLMERAAEIISQWICNNIDQQRPLSFFIGKGNNGGDGLAVARMLFNVGYNCDIYMVYDKKELSKECRYNLERLPRGLKIKKLDKVSIGEDTVVVDAILGSGIKGEIKDEIISVIELVNSLNCEVISIDLPSGMLTEYGNGSRKVVKATTTLALEYPKLSLLLPESGENAGKIETLSIELMQDFAHSVQTPYYYVDEEFAGSLMIARTKFSHKGDYGHALLVCGSEGMIGAAILAVGGALRSGCGLVTIHLPREERMALYATNPSAIVSCDNSFVFSHLPEEMKKYSCVGVGCGIGVHFNTILAFEKLLAEQKPMVIDADAINIISPRPDFMKMIPKGSILTPHIGELRRLIGEWSDDRERNDKVVELSAKLGCVIVVKGAHSMICTPQGDMFFNSTGCSGMAKAGSGDLLCGLITGLMARGYSSCDAAILGVYIHGRAGVKAAEYFGVESMNSSDMIDFFGEAMSELT